MISHLIISNDFCYLNVMTKGFANARNMCVFFKYVWNLLLAVFMRSSTNRIAQNDYQMCRCIGNGVCLVDLEHC